MRFAVTLLLAASSSSCALDERELSLDPGPSSLAGADAGGAFGNAGTGGGGGGAPPGLDAPPPPDCAYVGTRVEAGCDTIVSNPGFDQTALGWPGENAAVLVGWESLDAAESDDSGSIVVENRLTGSSEVGEVMIGAVQCVGATPGAVYDVRADLKIPEQETQGRAGISVLFYETGDCNTGMGGTDMSFTTDLLKKAEQWQGVTGRFVVPADVHSMEVRLIAAKAFKPQAFQVLFDNVLVQPK